MWIKEKQSVVSHNYTCMFQKNIVVKQPALSLISLLCFLSLEILCLSLNSSTVMGESHNFHRNDQQISLTSSHNSPPPPLWLLNWFFRGKWSTGPSYWTCSNCSQCHGCQNRKRATKWPLNNFLTLVQVFRLHHSYCCQSELLYHLPLTISLHWRTH